MLYTNALKSSVNGLAYNCQYYWRPWREHVPPHSLLRLRMAVAWVHEFRRGSSGLFQLNLWIPDPPAERDGERERRVREFLSQWGPQVSEDAGDATPPNFTAQCNAFLEAAPPVVSSVMGLYPSEFVKQLKQRRIT